MVPPAGRDNRIRRVFADFLLTTDAQPWSEDDEDPIARRRTGSGRRPHASAGCWRDGDGDRRTQFDGSRHSAQAIVRNLYRAGQRRASRVSCLALGESNGERDFEVLHSVLAGLVPNLVTGDAYQE